MSGPQTSQLRNRKTDILSIRPNNLCVGELTDAKVRQLTTVVTELNSAYRHAWVGATEAVDENTTCFSRRRTTSQAIYLSSIFSAPDSPMHIIC